MRMRKKTYPSDVSREQFRQILPILERARKRTKPWTVDLYEVWCAVHSYFSKWSELDDEGISLLERALKKSGWRGPRETGAQRLQHVLDRGRAEREEYRHGCPQGL